MNGAAQPQGGPAGDWQVPAAARPVRARLALPGSKSMTNRALVLAALADGPTRITGPLRARDTALMASALRELGSVIEDEPTPAEARRDQTGRDESAQDETPQDETGHADAGRDESAQDETAQDETGQADAGRDETGQAGSGWRVVPGRCGGSAEVDVGNAGTVMRFVPGVAALTGADVQFRGDGRASQRPVGPLLAALRELGATIDDGGRGAIPFVVRGRGSVRGGRVTLDASASSQLVSGLLLPAARYDKGAEVRHKGLRLPSAPHIAMTIQMLRDAGADVEAGTGRRGGTGHDSSVPDVWRVHPGALSPGTIAVEPDLSAAVPFLAAALVTGGSVTVAGWPARGLQPAALVLDLLARMGASCSLTAAGMRLTGSGEIHGITADLHEIGELTPVLTALAALADSPSVFTGVGHVRTHETDRLAALAGEIGGLGGEVIERSDGLEIRPRPLRADGTVFASHDDHRLVMAAAVLGLAVPGLRVRGAETVGKTFPGFPELWARMLEQSP
jgi:3-phosphoshikimate 1-carboxyvinyltransferase